MPCGAGMGLFSKKVSDSGLDFNQFLTAVKSFSSLDSGKSQERIVLHAASLLRADRATLFVREKDIARDKDELVVKVVDPSSKINRRIAVKVGVGIVGMVASKGKPELVDDAYECKAFNQDVDKVTGYKTKSLLTCPVFGSEAQVVGVLQVVNKKDGSVFTKSDLSVAEMLADHAGIHLQNAELHNKIQAERHHQRAMLDLVRSLHSDLGATSLIFTMTNKTHELVGADRTTLYFSDKMREELWSLQGAVEIRISANKGFAGHVATSGETLLIHDCYQDERFDDAYDKKTGYRTNNMLCMPIKDKTSNTIGVLQVINKLDGNFSSDDVQLLDFFLDIAGPIFETSGIYNKSAPLDSELDRAGDVTPEGEESRRKSTRGLSFMNEIAEDEDED